MSGGGGIQIKVYAIVYANCASRVGGGVKNSGKFACVLKSDLQ